MEEKEEELMYLNQQLQSERLMSKEERTRLIEEISRRETQVQEIRFQVLLNFSF